MADYEGLTLILLNLSNFVVQLATLTVNFIVLSTRKTKKYVIQALNASRKRLKKRLKRLNKRRRRKERIWCRPGRTNIWWENILANRTCTEEWKENFRMSRRHFFELCERLRPRLTGQNTNMRDALPVETKVAATLYYLADESKYRKVANAFGIGKTTLSKILRSVCLAIVELLGKEFIKIPTDDNGITSLASQFYAQHRFPQCIGVVDGTHIRIKQPKEKSLKARWGCLKGVLDVDLDLAPTLIYACFILHNYCELNNQSLDNSAVEAALCYDDEFTQPGVESIEEFNARPANRLQQIESCPKEAKVIRDIFKMHFE